jgi:hypothetical protein
MGEANSGMCVGVGRLNEIKAAKPTGGNLLPACATGLSAPERRRLLAHILRTYWFWPHHCFHFAHLASDWHGSKGAAAGLVIDLPSRVLR